MIVTVPQQEQGFTGYMKLVNQYPILEKQEEYMLAKRASDYKDVDAAQALVTSHLRLVVKIAMKMRSYKLSLMDLISEGNIGLMHAVKKFNPDLGYRLSTYAMWWIKSTIQEFIIKSWSLVKIGTTTAQKRLFFQLSKVKAKLKNVESNNDQIDDISDNLNVSKQEVVDMEQRLNDVSLDDPMSSDSKTILLETISNQNAVQEDIILENHELDQKRKLLQNAIKLLNDRERDIIVSRHLQEKSITLASLSNKYNVSAERVRQIEDAALKKLKTHCLVAE